MTCKHNSFTKSHLGACNMSFLRFFGMLSRLRPLELSLDPQNDLQMTSKWPKWPIMTWKHNYFTKSHVGACNMSFLRFFGMLSRLHKLKLGLDPPNDIQMISKWPKWPQITHNNLKTIFFSKSPLGHVICLSIIFLGCCIDCTYQIWVTSQQMISKWPSNDLKWSIMTWKHHFFYKRSLR